jgi:uncharacterized protein
MICGLIDMAYDHMTSSRYRSTMGILACCVLILTGATITKAQRPIPEHGGKWVHDEAGVLSGGAVVQLEAILNAERDSTSNQIAVLVIRSLEDDAIEDYALRVAEAWGLGKKDRDNGVLLLIAMEDRQMRIEVGYGLEGVLTDAVSSQINRNEIAPHFRQGDFDAGITAGVMAIIRAIAGEYVNDEVKTPRRTSRRSPWPTLLILIVIIFLSSRRGRGGRGGRGGGYWSSGAGWMGMGGFGGGGGGFGGGGSFGGGGGFGGGGSSSSW